MGNLTIKLFVALATVWAHVVGNMQTLFQTSLKTCSVFYTNVLTYVDSFFSFCLEFYSLVIYLCPYNSYFLCTEAHWTLLQEQLHV